MVHVLQNIYGTLIVSDVVDGLRLIPNNYVDMVFFSPPYYKRRRYGFERKWFDGWFGELGWEDSVNSYAKHLAYIVKIMDRVVKENSSIFIEIDDNVMVQDRVVPFSWFNGRYVDVSHYVANEIKRIGWRLVKKYVIAKGCFDTFHGLYYSRVHPMNNRVHHHSYSFVLQFSRMGEVPKYYSLIPSDVILISNNYVHPNRVHSSQFSRSVLSVFIDAFTKKKDVVLDPFAGVGTTGIVAKDMGRKFVLIEANKDVISYEKLGF